MAARGGPLVGGGLIRTEPSWLAVAVSIKDQDAPGLDYDAARRELEKGIHRLRELTAEARMIFEQLEEGGDGGRAPGLRSYTKPRD